MCALGVIWGGSFLFIKISLETVGPWTSAAIRTLIAGILLSTIAPTMGQKLTHIQILRSWVFGILIGVVSIAGFTFITSLLTIVVINKFMPIRATDEEQYEGLDKSEIGVEAYPEF